MVLFITGVGQVIKGWDVGLAGTAYGTNISTCFQDEFIFSRCFILLLLYIYVIQCVSILRHASW